jgi:hypothetical protein
VFCDGQQHEASVMVCCGPFDAGKAFAFAQLFAPSSQASDSKTINIGR